MPTTHHDLSHIIVAHWGLAGSATKGQLGYRAQNPWQALQRYMQQRRGDADKFFPSYGASAAAMDSGGSVWKVELATVPTKAELFVKEFAKQLLMRLALQNTKPAPADRIIVSYADGVSVGRWEWTP